MKDKITDPDLRNLTPGKSKVESLGKSLGAMVFRHKGKVTSGYYRYWKGKQSIFIKLGTYKPPRTKVAGFTLKEIREKANELATLRQQISPQDLKEYLSQQEEDRQQQVEEKKQQEAIEASKGTFEDLLNAYVANLYRLGRSSARQTETSLKRTVKKPYPDMLKVKANKIVVDDIIKIIRRMISSGVTTQSNRVRSYLHAAFEYGLRADNDPMQQEEHGKRFYLHFNPVHAVPRQAQFERIRDRVLSNDEIRFYWLHFEKGRPTHSKLYGLLIRFMISAFGNRPEQLNHCLWSDFDFNNRTLVFFDSKGKSARKKKRIIPLTSRAIDILEQARQYSGNNPGPFYIGKKSPIDIGNFCTYVQYYNDWLEQQARDKGEPVPERWTAKDIRGTATRLFTDCRVPKEQRYLLQSREDNSIESKHYDHDDRLPEKRDVARIYDNYLGQILSDTVPDKLVDLEQYRQFKGR